MIQLFLKFKLIKIKKRRKYFLKYLLNETNVMYLIKI